MSYADQSGFSFTVLFTVLKTNQTHLFHTPDKDTLLVTHVRAEPGQASSTAGTNHSARRQMDRLPAGSQQPCFWTTDFLFRPGCSKSAALSLHQHHQHHFLPPPSLTLNLRPWFPSFWLRGAAHDRGGTEQIPPLFSF